MNVRLTGIVALIVTSLTAAGITAGRQSTPPADSERAARELRMASRLARDGDLQADWNKLLDARSRLERLTGQPELAPMVRYNLGYVDWRLSSLVYMSSGMMFQAPYWRRGITELEEAIRLKPDFADAHALLAILTGSLMGSDPSQAEKLRPRLVEAWKAALDVKPQSGRALVLRGMALYATPPQYGGNREKGLEMWREGIALLEKEPPNSPLAPEWGLAEAWGWYGGALLMNGDFEQAVSALAHALGLRNDFWWVSRIAMPQAKRPDKTRS
jgi:tetratricopeptide (TPR) repeat protein